MTAPSATADRVWKSFSRERVQALRGATLEVAAGSAVALVGSSGSGKSTLAKCLAGLLAPDRGTVLFGGQPIAFPAPVQLVFQHVSVSMNPAFTAARAIAEPLEIAGVGSASSRRLQAVRRLEELEIPPQFGNALIAELSGGQKARVALARALCALAGRPGLLILDETLTSLDIPLQRRIARFLHTVRRRDSVAILLITHDWNLAVSFADEVRVMDSGEVRDSGCEAGRALADAAPPFLHKVEGA